MIHKVLAFGQIVHSVVNADPSDLEIEAYAFNAKYYSLAVSVRQTECFCYA